mmetsp:Transcript_24823/g.67024  ORF Transcript_24823/g.67024 Transcript_24823/m.67024 type:complete len:97 (-) Transcript_24823:1483-1773(-)
MIAVEAVAVESDTSPPFTYNMPGIKLALRLPALVRPIPDRFEEVLADAFADAIVAADVTTDAPSLPPRALMGINVVRFGLVGISSASNTEFSESTL